MVIMDGHYDILLLSLHVLLHRYQLINNNNDTINITFSADVTH